VNACDCIQLDMELTENEIKKIAEDFRRAINATSFPKGTEANFFMRRFPYEGCIIACKLLSRYLAEKYGCVEIVEFRGEVQESDGTSHGHHWLEYNGTTIDITCDQFGHLTKNISITVNSNFHNQHVNKKENLGKCIGSSHMLGWEREAYDLILKTLAVHKKTEAKSD
jgi:hypothetical protein